MQDQAPPPPPTPAPPAPPADVQPAVAGDPALAAPVAAGNPAEAYRAAVAQRRELQDQVETLRDERQNVVQELRLPRVEGPDRTGLEQRLGQIDQRLATLSIQVAEADARVALAAGIPGATVPEPRPPRDGPPEEVFAVAALFVLCAVLPLSIAYARRIWRRSTGAVAEIPQELSVRFGRLEEAVDAIAVEVERIGEGQRFMTRIFSDEGAPQPRAISGGLAERIELSRRAPVEEARRSPAPPSRSTYRTPQ